MPTWVRDRLLPAAAALVLGAGAGVVARPESDDNCARLEATVQVIAVQVQHLERAIEALVVQVDRLRDAQGR